MDSGNTHGASEISAVDLFCGAGGLTHGLLQSGINVVAGFDIQKDCKFAYEHNNLGAKFFQKKVEKITAGELMALYPAGHIRLLAGCAPCQPFSRYSQGRDVRNDKKWPLLYEFARLIDETRPELITMENVPDVVKHKVYEDFVIQLEKIGYSVWAQKVYCPDYGVPQGRSRHVLLGSCLTSVQLLKPTNGPSNYVSVREAISKLPKLSAGESCAKDKLHIAAGLSPINLKRIKKSKPGGTWKDWPEELRAECHRKESGRGYKSIYARMEWDLPSPTITTQCYGYGNGRFGHPDQNRAISLREAAMLQTFPEDYLFVPQDKPVTMAPVGKMIGNAVPVALGNVIGKSLQRSLVC